MKLRWGVVAGGRAAIHRRLFEEKKEERDHLLKKVRDLKRKRLEKLERLSEPSLRKTKLSEVNHALHDCCLSMWI